MDCPPAPSPLVPSPLKPPPPPPPPLALPALLPPPPLLPPGMPSVLAAPPELTAPPPPPLDGPMAVSPPPPPPPIANGVLLGPTTKLPPPPPPAPMMLPPVPPSIPQRSATLPPPRLPPLWVECGPPEAIAAAGGPPVERSVVPARDDWGWHSVMAFGAGRLIQVAVGLAKGTGTLLTNRAGARRTRDQVRPAARVSPQLQRGFGSAGWAL